jgi:hypothetical protein
VTAESTRRSGPLRALLVASISLLGVVMIVGSGGGSLGFPPCESKTVCGDDPTPPGPAAAMSPTWYTALVGSPASFTVTTFRVTGTLTYQWHRSSDGGTSFIEIPGATSATYSIPSVNLADDKTVFRADVRINGVPTFSMAAFLAVSSVPGVVLQDDEFLAASWLASPVPGDTGAVPVHLEESPATGGNPGPFRKMTFQVPAGNGNARVFYSSLPSTYDPATQGAVYVIDYSEDCIDLVPGFPGSSLSNLVIEQGGRRFLSNTFDGCNATTWRTGVNRASLARGDFRLFDGPACAAGETCPDFSASAAPMRFGYWRMSVGDPGASIAHGIDNWKVTVWKR